MRAIGQPKTNYFCRIMIKEVDQTGTGTVSYDDFLNAMLGNKENTLKMILMNEVLNKQSEVSVGAYAVEGSLDATNEKWKQKSATWEDKVADGYDVDSYLGTLKALFISHDTTGNGEINFSELRNWMRAIGQPKTNYFCRIMIKEVDQTGTGTISYDDFLNAMLGNKENTLKMILINEDFTRQDGVELAVGSGSTRLYVGGLTDDCTRTELERAFDYFGAIKNVWIAHNPAGFGFVTYEKGSDAAKAVKEMDNQRVCGVRVRVDFARKGLSAAAETEIGAEGSIGSTSYLKSIAFLLFSFGAGYVFAKYKAHKKNDYTVLDGSGAVEMI